MNTVVSSRHAWLRMDERRAIVLCADSDDFREGSQAFFERREARFG